MEINSVAFYACFALDKLAGGNGFGPHSMPVDSLVEFVYESRNASRTVKRLLEGDEMTLMDNHKAAFSEYLSTLQKALTRQLGAAAAAAYIPCRATERRGTPYAIRGVPTERIRVVQ